MPRRLKAGKRWRLDTSRTASGSVIPGSVRKAAGGIDHVVSLVELESMVSAQARPKLLNQAALA